MPIRLRFLLVANVFLVGLGIVGFLAVTNLDRAANRFSDATRRGMNQVNLSDQLRASIPDLRSLELEYVMASDPASSAAVGAKMSERRRSLKQVMTRYHQEGEGASISSCGVCHHVSSDRRAIAVSAVGVSVFGSVASPGTSGDPPNDTGDAALQGCTACHQVLKRFLEMHSRIQALASAGRREEALVAFKQADAPYAELLSQADTFRQTQFDVVTRESAEGHAAGVAARNTLIATFALAAVVTFLVGHHFSLFIHRRLAVLGEGTHRVARGELSQPIVMGGRDEFSDLANTFNTMTQSLRNSQFENAQLHEAAIRMHEERIALLSDGLKRATEAQENERTRVARELHDEVGQALTGLQFGLSRLTRMTRSARIREHAEELKDLTVETLRGVRNLALDLRPSLLDSIGLPATLHQYVESYSARTGVPVGLSIRGYSARMRPDLETTIFRIVQEALTNTARYANASRAWVALSLEDGALTLIVGDNGSGFDLDATRADYRRSLGISGMEERCRFSSGAFGIRSAPGHGTTVTCTWEPATTGPNAAAKERPTAGFDSGKVPTTHEGD